jgi:hypothetical protein
MQLLWILGNKTWQRRGVLTRLFSYQISEVEVHFVLVAATLQ